MGVSKFLFQVRVRKCGIKCYFVVQAKVPGSYMRDYEIEENKL